MQTEPLEQVVQSEILALHKIHFKLPDVESVQTDTAIIKNKNLDNKKLLNINY